MGNKGIGIGAVVAASAVSMLLATTASAAVIVHPAGTAVAAVDGLTPPAMNWPNGDHMVCGTAYEGDWVDVAAPPAGAAAVEDAKVTGTLYNGFGIQTWTDNVLTSADGTWCLTGTSSMAITVGLGGWVKLCAEPSTLPSGKALDADGTGADCRSVNVGTFLAHAYPAPSASAKSASWFNFAYK